MYKYINDRFSMLFNRQESTQYRKGRAMLIFLIRFSAATLGFALFRDLQAINEVPLRLVFIISGIRGDDWLVGRQR